MFIKREYLNYFISKDYIRQIYSPPDNICNYYFIDRYSNIFSLYSNLILSTCIKENGYIAVSLNTIDGKRIQRKVHRLTMLTFCYYPGCELLEVNHKDGNKLNNFIDNLEWVTPKENIQHAINNQLRESWSGENNPNVKLTNDIINDIYNRLINGESKDSIKIFYNISDSTINSIINGRVWKEVITSEMIENMQLAVHNERLLIREKHTICKYFEENKLLDNGFGKVKNHIINSLISNNIEVTESHFNQAKRLFYKYQDPEITSCYNF